MNRLPKQNSSPFCLGGRNFRQPLTGRTFGRLTVMGFDYTSPRGTVWRCRCECGTFTTALTTDLLRTRRPKRSCGCLRVEQLARNRQIAHSHLESRKRDRGKFA